MNLILVWKGSGNLLFEGHPFSNFLTIHFLPLFYFFSILPFFKFFQFQFFFYFFCFVVFWDFLLGFLLFYFLSFTSFFFFLVFCFLYFCSFFCFFLFLPFFFSFFKILFLLFFYLYFSYFSISLCLANHHNQRIKEMKWLNGRGAKDRYASSMSKRFVHGVQTHTYGACKRSVCTWSVMTHAKHVV